MKAEKSVKHLFKRGEIFYFRLALPKSLHTIIRRNEWKVSLRTSDRALARRRCRILTNKIEEFFMALNMQSELTSSQLIDISRSFFRELLVNHNDRIFWIEEMWGNDPEDRANAIAFCDEYSQALKQKMSNGGNIKEIKVAVDAQLKKHGHLSLFTRS